MYILFLHWVTWVLLLLVFVVFLPSLCLWYLILTITSDTSWFCPILFTPRWFLPWMLKSGMRLLIPSHLEQFAQFITTESVQISPTPDLLMQKEANTWQQGQSNVFSLLPCSTLVVKKRVAPKVSANVHWAGWGPVTISWLFLWLFFFYRVSTSFTIPITSLKSNLHWLTFPHSLCSISNQICISDITGSVILTLYDIVDMASCVQSMTPRHACKE